MKDIIEHHMEEDFKLYKRYKNKNITLENYYRGRTDAFEFCFNLINKKEEQTNE